MSVEAIWLLILALAVAAWGLYKVHQVEARLALLQKCMQHMSSLYGDIGFCTCDECQTADNEEEVTCFNCHDLITRKDAADRIQMPMGTGYICQGCAIADEGRLSHDDDVDGPGEYGMGGDFWKQQKGNGDD